MNQENAGAKPCALWHLAIQFVQLEVILIFIRWRRSSKTESSDERLQVMCGHLVQHYVVINVIKRFGEVYEYRSYYLLMISSPVTDVQDIY